jgi:hypothetical protein
MLPQDYVLGYSQPSLRDCSRYTLIDVRQIEMIR